MSNPPNTPPLPDPPGLVEGRRGAHFLSRFTLFGGRRRAEDGRGADRYGILEAVVMLGVLLLNLIDTGATLFYVQEDIGTELNPVARWLMSHGSQAFIWTKSLGVGAVLLVLVTAKECFWARLGLWITMALQSAIALGHTYTLCLYLAGKAGSGGV